MLHFQTIRHAQSTEWIVFIHGAGGSSNVWFLQIRSFAARYNLLFVDLRGHGLSVREQTKRTYAFSDLAADVLEIIAHLKLNGCHFIGLSLGTIIIHEIADRRPQLVKSMILAGAVLRLNLRAKLLAKGANVLKHIIPYMALYRIYAHIIMPRSAHRNSRIIFINNALKITHNEFLNWMTLNKNINYRLAKYTREEPPIPTLYVMGENDYVFLSQVHLQLRKNHRNSFLSILPQAGHICNIDQSEAFNTVVHNFLNDFALTPAPIQIP